MIQAEHTGLLTKIVLAPGTQCSRRSTLYLLPTCGLSVYIMFRNMFTPCFKPCLHTVWRYFYIWFKDLYAKCLNKYLYNVWKHVCIKFENMFASGNSCFNTTLPRISGHVYTLFENILTNFTYIFYIGPHVRLRLVAVLF